MQYTKFKYQNKIIGNTPSETIEYFYSQNVHIPEDILQRSISYQIQWLTFNGVEFIEEINYLCSDKFEQDLQVFLMSRGSELICIRNDSNSFMMDLPIVNDYYVEELSCG